MSEAKTLHTKYRPQKLEEVLGHDTVVKSLKKVVGENRAQTFLFTGSSGCGKTTLSRIVASMVGCGPSEIEEINAASNTGVDDMRVIMDALQYRPLTESGKKALILDECHMLSKSAWNSLLKITEEPPDWVYWFFCTTEPGKVPATIKTRCVHYDLKPVSNEKLFELLDEVAACEGIDVDAKVLNLCAKEAMGSPRQALTNLSLCATAGNTQEAADLLMSAHGSTEAFELAKALINGASWVEVVKLLSGLTESDPESVRCVVQAYVSKVALGSASNDKKTMRCLAILDAFNSPFYNQKGMGPLLVACGEIYFS